MRSQCRATPDKGVVVKILVGVTKTFPLVNRKQCANVGSAIWVAVRHKQVTNHGVGITPPSDQSKYSDDKLSYASTNTLTLPRLLDVRQFLLYFGIRAVETTETPGRPITNII